MQVLRYQSRLSPKSILDIVHNALKKLIMKSRILGLLIVCALFSSNSILAQDLMGVRTSRYIGGTSAVFNPANIADSRHKFSLNLFSFDLMLNNSHVNFDRNSVKNLSDIGDVFKDTDQPISAKMNFNVIGPGILFKINQKSSVAINTRIRTLVDVNQIDAALYNNLSVSSEELETGIKNINSPYKQYANVTGWGEIGFTYARTLLDHEAHFLKAGVTAKYLKPVSNYSIQIDNLNGTIVTDAATESANLVNTSGRIGFEQSGMDIQSFENVKVKDFLKSDNPSIGFDVGIVYEYRPNHSKYRNSETGKYDSPKEKYFLRLGVAVLDFGNMKFNRNAANSGTFDMDINGFESYDLRELEDVEIPGGILSHLRNRPQYFVEQAVSNPEIYTLKMPTNLNIDLDLRLASWFYINGAYQKFTDTKNEFGQSLASLDNFTITPRIDLKSFGLYLPINNSELTGTNVGAAIRFGGFFLGSSNVLSLLSNDGSKRINLYMGLSLGLWSKK